MENKEKLVEICTTIQSKIKRPEVKRTVEKELKKRLIDYKVENSGNSHRTVKILEWLIRTDPASRDTYETEREAFIETINREEATKAGKPCIESLKAELTHIVSGMEIKLTWKVKNPGVIRLFDHDRNEVPHTSDFAKVTPFQSANEVCIKTYRLVVENNSGKDEKQVDITVFPVPVLDVIPAKFPVLESNVSVNINVSVPSFHITETMEDILNKVNFYPDILRAAYNYDTVNKKYKSPFNVHFIYERIKQFLTRKGKHRI